MMVITCCHGCKDRHVGCHGQCAAYQEQHRERQAELDARQERYRAHALGYHTDAEIVRIERETRRKKRKWR